MELTLSDINGYGLKIRVKQTGKELEDLFIHHPEDPGAILVNEKGCTIGLISRKPFREMLSTTFGREL